MNTGKITYLFRKIGWMHLLDKMKYHFYRLKNQSINNAFAEKHPGVALPPDYMMFEAFQLNYEKYFYGGRQTAEWIRDQIQASLKPGGHKILDWGCGPARICRHLPELMGPEYQIYGTDYNPKTIAWCRAHIKGVDFQINGIHPPTTYTPDSFDAIYGISIFTHLSEDNHQQWMAELYRILAKEGVLLITTHGKAYKEILTDPEIKLFERGALITRDQAVEGHRVYAAFHPPAYMRQLFEQHRLEIISHQPGQKKNWGIEQDTWIVKKK